MSSSITTRRGDDGTTSLLYGQRVPKDHPQIEALGTCDELNTALGLARAAGGDAGASALLLSIQKDLVALMGELACDGADLVRYRESKFPKLDEASLARVDAAAAALESRGLRFDGWATPGATPLAAAYDNARTTARRCERRLVSLSNQGREVGALTMAYLNRVSDLLWLLAREAEQNALPGLGRVQD
jgi:cob(I)alamin adenosyltransferase